MNFGSDHRVRDAFRATLLDEPSSAAVVGTQEIDAADVLEVTDLAHAIARAEEALRARSSRAVSARGSDLFDRLITSKQPTDDTAGPALHAPYHPTPLPPRTSEVPLPPGVMRPATLLRAPDALASTPFPAPTENAGAYGHYPVREPAVGTPAIPPAPQTAPLLTLDDDAFYHPAGRIRTLAEATLDGYRPEPTVLVRLRERRHALSWIVLLVLAPILIIALIAGAIVVASRSGANRSPAPNRTAAEAPTAAPAPPVDAAEGASNDTSGASASSDSDVPVFDVNSLKSAPHAKKKRR